MRGGQGKETALAHFETFLLLVAKGNNSEAEPDAPRRLFCLSTRGCGDHHRSFRSTSSDMVSDYDVRDELHLAYGRHASGG